MRVGGCSALLARGGHTECSAVSQLYLIRCKLHHSCTLAVPLHEAPSLTGVISYRFKVL